MAEKKSLCQITAFYQGGTKLRADLSTNREDTVKEINLAKKEVRDAVLDTVEADGNESTLYITRTNLLFYNIVVPKVEGLIEVVGAGGSPSLLK